MSSPQKIHPFIHSGLENIVSHNFILSKPEKLVFYFHPEYFDYLCGGNPNGQEAHSYNWGMMNKFVSRVRSLRWLQAPDDEPRAYSYPGGAIHYRITIPQADFFDHFVFLLSIQHSSKVRYVSLVIGLPWDIINKHSRENSEEQLLRKLVHLAQPRHYFEWPDLCVIIWNKRESPSQKVSKSLRSIRSSKRKILPVDIPPRELLPPVWPQVMDYLVPTRPHTEETRNLLIVFDSMEHPMWHTL